MSDSRTYQLSRHTRVKLSRWVVASRDLMRGLKDEPGLIVNGTDNPSRDVAERSRVLAASGIALHIFSTGGST